jgi:plastocyanin domain-containing protein
MRQMLGALALAAALAAAIGCEEGSKGSGQTTSATVVPPEAIEAIEIRGRRIDINVTKQGYKPASVEAKPNEEVTLVFTRTEPTECGREIAIPSIGFQKELPMNQPVAATVKADKAGEIRFTCGMNMFSGALVVKN